MPKLSIAQKKNKKQQFFLHQPNFCVNSRCDPANFGGWQMKSLNQFGLPIRRQGGIMKNIE